MSLLGRHLRPRPGDIHEGRGDIDADHVCTPQRRFHGEGAGSAARIEETSTGKILRQPGQKGIAHAIAAREPSPDPPHGASEVSRAQASSAVRSK